MNTRSEHKSHLCYLVANVLVLGVNYDIDRILKVDWIITSICTLLSMSADEVKNMRKKSTDGAEESYFTALEIL